MSAPSAPATGRSALTAALAVLAAVGLLRIAVRFAGIALLLGVVLACVGALTLGVVLLKSAAGL